MPSFAHVDVPAARTRRKVGSQHDLARTVVASRPGQHLAVLGRPQRHPLVVLEVRRRLTERPVEVQARPAREDRVGVRVPRERGEPHLRDVGEKIWDKRPLSLTLDERIFGSDPKITTLYRQFLLGCDWQQHANQLTLSTASTLLLTHLLQNYSNVQWKLPVVTGGLSPFVLRNVLAFIEENLGQPLTLAELAAQAALSEYHFARMFRQSTGLAPHQYVMQRRMEKAKALVQNTATPLTDIALACGFNSASHFSNRFRSATGMTPSQLRAASA